MASSDSRLNYVPAPQPALSQSASLALSLTKSNKVFGGTGILKWIHFYLLPGGHRHLLQDETQPTVRYQPRCLNWIINLWEQLKLGKQGSFLGRRGHISGEAAGKISVGDVLFAVFCSCFSVSTRSLSASWHTGPRCNITSYFSTFQRAAAFPPPWSSLLCVACVRLCSCRTRNMKSATILPALYPNSVAGVCRSLFQCTWGERVHSHAWE